MKGLSLLDPIDPKRLEKETLRIYEICDGCRRCFNLCPSFNTLLDRIDVYEGDAAKLTPAASDCPLAGLQLDQRGSLRACRRQGHRPSHSSRPRRLRIAVRTVMGDEGRVEEGLIGGRCTV